MNKHIVSLASLLACVLLTAETLADATESVVPEPFVGFDSDSKFAINYDDLTDLLTIVVADVGLSKREIAKIPEARTGTRMTPKIQRLTTYEANRVAYEAFKDNEEAKSLLREIQESLQKIPDEMPLDQFSRDEQLAYWLNLYNVTVLNEIIAIYPKRNLKRLLHGKKSILDKKLLRVSGVSLSLNDIQHNILRQNYNNDPRIMYGLYQGIVGGPNIRKSAYTGDDVYYALEDNAYEFINSNRGTFSRSDEDVMRVSSFYDRNKAFFPQFDNQLSQHLLEYLRDGAQRSQLQVVDRIEPNINDWTVTDMGGTRHEISGSFADNHAALLDSYQGPKRIDGGRMVASIEVKRPKKENDKDEDEEDAVALENLGVIPIGEGAAPEDITTGDVD